FACDTNSGSETLVGSFVLGVDIPQASGLEVVLDLRSALASLPAWWEFFTPGSCRQSSLSVTLIPDPANVVCRDWGEWAAIGGLAAYQTPVAGSARIKIVDAVPSNTLKHLTPGIEYFAFNALINHAGTVGTGSCAGCAIAVCIVFNSILVTQPPVCDVNGC